MTALFEKDKLTNVASKLGTGTVLYDILCEDTTVIAPGGKLVAIYELHMSMASMHKQGAACIAEILHSASGLLRIQNKSSMVDTFMVET